MFTGRVPFFRDCDARVGVLIQRGIRPERMVAATPLGLSDEIWALMETCWSEVWRKRPRIRRVLEALRANLQQHEMLDVSPPKWPLPTNDDQADMTQDTEVDSDSDHTIRLPGRSH